MNINPGDFKFYCSKQAGDNKSRRSFWVILLQLYLQVAAIWRLTGGKSVLIVNPDLSTAGRKISPKFPAKSRFSKLQVNTISLYQPLSMKINLQKVPYLTKPIKWHFHDLHKCSVSKNHMRFTERHAVGRQREQSILKKRALGYSSKLALP